MLNLETPDDIKSPYLYDALTRIIQQLAPILYDDCKTVKEETISLSHIIQFMVSNNAHVDILFSDNQLLERLINVFTNTSLQSSVLRYHMFEIFAVLVQKYRQWIKPYVVSSTLTQRLVELDKQVSQFVQ